MDKSRFRAMLLAISDKLDEDHLKKLKFLCQEDIGRKKLEKINKGIDVFECLIERAKIGPDNTDVLRRLLDDIGQKVLVDIIDNYERHATGSPAEIPDAKEQEKINIATEVMVVQLGRRWTLVGRKLGLTTTKLEGIKEKHHNDLEEQVRELVREWMKMQKNKARVQELIQALRACMLNLTADLVEKKLKEIGTL
ncbi:FAS-associated death domain protein-like [Myxocyprinus asiaticus]|uniref:FAS-associated death domain protein-like n=1 Tax=Myxocyprinus asiaticus TaxID=70543 RepID=UPI00222291C2|nr:FAS-associated death domain protein-like [Myxocyprinus asiaticus]